MSTDIWKISISPPDKVFIQPPKAIDRLYDDLYLSVTGNFLQEDRIKIAQTICDKLNQKG